MDVRLQNIVDPDSRMVDNVGTEENPIYESRIAKLTPEEMGFIHVNSLFQDGVAVEYSVQGTVLEVVLAEPIASGGQATLEMDLMLKFQFKFVAPEERIRMRCTYL
jgi:hypothetical protein